MNHANVEPSSFQPRLRAMVEITSDGELKVYPICDNDIDERRILDALRFAREERSGE